MPNKLGNSLLIMVSQVTLSQEAMG